MISRPVDDDTILPRSLIVTEEPPTDGRTCIEFLLERVAATGRLTDRESALEAVLERERCQPTGVGHGVALPHGKTEAVTAPTVALVHSSSGIDFDGIGEEPVVVVALLLVPPDSSDRYLSVLSGIARALLDEDVRATIASESNPETIRRTLLGRVESIVDERDGDEDGPAN